MDGIIRQLAWIMTQLLLFELEPERDPELIAELEPERDSELIAGDRVRLNPAVKLRTWKVVPEKTMGTVLKAENGQNLFGKSSIRVTVKFDDDYGEYTGRPSSFEKVEEPEFAVGDRVYITNHDKYSMQFAHYLGIPEGTTGTIRSNAMGYCVSFDFYEATRTGLPKYTHWDGIHGVACWVESLKRVE